MVWPILSCEAQSLVVKGGAIVVDQKLRVNATGSQFKSETEMITWFPEAHD